jgi:hypothetical protein
MKTKNLKRSIMLQLIIICLSTALYAQESDETIFIKRANGQVESISLPQGDSLYRFKANLRPLQGTPSQKLDLLLGKIDQYLVDRNQYKLAENKWAPISPVKYKHVIDTIRRSDDIGVLKTVSGDPEIKAISQFEQNLFLAFMVYAPVILHCIIWFIVYINLIWYNKGVRAMRWGINFAIMAPSISLGYGLLMSYSVFSSGLWVSVVVVAALLTAHTIQKRLIERKFPINIETP